LTYGEEMPRHLIIRPWARSVKMQLTDSIVAAAGFSVAGIFFHVRDSVVWVICVAGAFLFVSALQVLDYWKFSPDAIVATDEFLGLAYRNGIKKRIPWGSISYAGHSTGVLGRQWTLQLTSKEKIAIRDVGIDHERWGKLRKFIAEIATSHGAKVFVDPLSVVTYGDF
jgi:hypothetical protein